MKISNLILVAFIAAILASCGSTSADDWSGTYTGTFTLTEVDLEDGETDVDSDSLTFVLAPGAGDDELLWTIDRISRTITFDGDEADISAAINEDGDYNTSNGTLNLDGDRIVMDWEGATDSYEETVVGTFDRVN